MYKEKLLKIGGLIVLLLVIFTAIYLIDTNTSFLNLFIAPQDISRNNSNPLITSGISVGEQELTTLISQEVTVPEEFRTGVFETARQLNLPKNFRISVFMAGMKKPRFFDFDGENNLIVADMAANEMIMLK